MSYAAATDVQAEFAGVDFSKTNAKVTSAQVTEWIAQADVEINSAISGVYQTPIVAGDGLILLKQISIMLAGDRVESKLHVNSGAEPLDRVHGRSRRKDSLAMLEKIRKGDLALAGATKISSSDGVQSAATTSPCVRHIFKKGVNQW